jgi:hypothetical protein
MFARALAHLGEPMSVAGVVSLLIEAGAYEARAAQRAPAAVEAFFAWRAEMLKRAMLAGGVIFPMSALWLLGVMGKKRRRCA